MGSPIGLLMVAGAVVGALVLGSRSANAAPKGGARAVGALVPGHRYKIVFNADDVSRNAPTFAATSGLAVRVAQLGWTRVTLQPDPSDANLFTWRAEATWTGDRPTLSDGLGVRFLGVVDLDALASPSGNGGQIFDPNLSPNDTATVLAALQRETDISKLTELANSLDPEFPIAAKALRDRIAAIAAQLGGQQPAPRPQPPPTPGPSPVAPSPPPPTPGPIFVPPQLPPQPQPFPQPFPPAPPPPPAPVQPQGPQRFDPGLLPPLPPIPPAGFNKTAKHRNGQLALANWATLNQPGAFSTADADGQIGPRTQHVTQAFQKWANVNRGLSLMLDGLFGDQTYAALREFGFSG